MKLQYYLRGLGIGILVTAMIFCILPGGKEMLSDEEIRARALELGMVESSSLTLADIQNKQESEANANTSQVQQPESTESQKQEETAADADKKAEAESTAEMPSAPQESTVPSDTTAGEQEAAPEVLKITVESGANSYTVSKILEEKQLVEDAGEFDDYLCNYGYSRYIRVGTHKIPMGATWEEIAKILSGKQ